MALRDQPYIPLYVQDFMTDEKLSECSAESTGVYIRVMCIMHKSQEYGTVLLKQKDKQNASTVRNFAVKLHRLMPYSVEVIERSLAELVEEEVLMIEGDMLMQKRMVKDGNLSLIRANAGSKGGKATQDKKIANDFAKANTKAKGKAKTQANSEYEYEYEIEYEDEVISTKNTASSDITVTDKKKPGKNIPPSLDEVEAYCKSRNNAVNARSFIDFYTAKGWMIGKSKMKDWHASVRTWEQNSKGTTQLPERKMVVLSD